MAPNFIIKGTESDMDGCEVLCGELHNVQFYDKNKNLQSMKIRQLLNCPTWMDEEGGFDILEVRGIWIEDGYLFQIIEENLEEFKPTHIKTITVAIDNFNINFTQYDSRLQVSVVKLNQNYANETIYSEYKPISQFGNIKFLLEEVDSVEDIPEFIEQVKDLM